MNDCAALPAAGKSHARRAQALPSQQYAVRALTRARAGEIPFTRVAWSNPKGTRACTCKRKLPGTEQLPLSF